MKTTIDENLKRIEKLQTEIEVLSPIVKSLTNQIGIKQDEIQTLQSNNSCMLEEMKAGKNIE